MFLTQVFFLIFVFSFLINLYFWLPRYYISRVKYAIYPSYDTNVGTSWKFREGSSPIMDKFNIRALFVLKSFLINRL